MAEPTTDRRVSVVVKAYDSQGYECSFDLALPLTELQEALRRLQAAGYSPQAPRAAQTAPSAPQGRQNGSGRAAKVTPAYDADGTPRCPEHGTELIEGRYGPYCPTKGGKYTNLKGYCNLKFED